MRFTRIKNPDAVTLLVPWFVPVNQTREEILLELKERMSKHSDDTFVLVAFMGNVIKGFAVAYTRASDVFLWQARSEGLTRRYVDIGFNAICDWARKKGFNKLVTIPNRRTDIWMKRWGFKEAENGDVYKEI